VQKVTNFTDREYQESLILEARHVLGTALAAHGGLRAWHYGVLLHESHPSSLASFLQVKLSQLLDYLEFCGLVDSRRFIISKSWESFLIEKGLDGYFDKMKIKEVEDKRHWWLRLGTFEVEGGHGAQFRHNPSTYSSSFTRRRP
jgi:hypothetical protein